MGTTSANAQPGAPEPSTGPGEASASGCALEQQPRLPVTKFTRARTEPDRHWDDSWKRLSWRRYLGKTSLQKSPQLKPDYCK